MNLKSYTEETVREIYDAGGHLPRDVAIELVKALAQRDAPIEGLSPGPAYTMADVDLIEAIRGKPYERLRATVEQRNAAFKRLEKIIADWDYDEIGQLDGALIDDARSLLRVSK